MRQDVHDQSRCGNIADSEDRIHVAVVERLQLGCDMTGYDLDANP